MINMYGWDIIAATTQGVINKGLQKKFPLKPFTKSFSIKVLWIDITVSISVNIGPPKILAVNNEKRLIQVFINLENVVLDLSLFGKYELDNIQIKVTTSLASVKAELQPTNPKDGINYDLIIDILNKDAIIDVHLSGVPEFVRSIIEHGIKDLLQDYAKKDRYVIANYNLGKISDELQYIIPKFAEFTIFANNQNSDNSMIAVLMSTRNEERRTDFSQSLVPDRSDAAVIFTNDKFMAFLILPSLIKSLNSEPYYFKGEYRDNKITITNSEDIPLKMDYSPYITSLKVLCGSYVADSNKPLNGLITQITVKCDVKVIGVTLAHIVIDIDNGYSFIITTEKGKQVVKFENFRHKEHHTIDVEIWAWLISYIILGIIGVLVLLVGKISLDIKIGNDFNDFSISNSVLWLYTNEQQKYLNIQNIDLPDNLLMTGTIPYIE